VTSVYQNGNTGEPTGNHGVVMDEMIVGMQDIRAIDSQLADDLPKCARVGSSRLVKGMDFYAGTLGFCREPPRMSQTIDCRLMTFGELTLREVENKPFQAAHIEIIDELNYSHGFKSSR
jgi:hypothetical protein